MIGLSLSLCVLDVIEGKVPVENIEQIITGTAYRDRDTFIREIDRTYCNTYWRKNPSRAFCIAVDLWDQGKLDQPRVRGEKPPYVGQGHWVPTPITVTVTTTS